MDDIAVLKKELAYIFARFVESEEFQEGFYCAMAGVEEPNCSYGVSTTMYDDFMEGAEVGERTLGFLGIEWERTKAR